MQICFGNLAPDGIVFKVSSLNDPRFRGPAMCFETGKEVSDAVAQHRIRPGSVIVLRYQGPVASGMPEVVLAAAALSVPELNGQVALISDTRVSGISHGAMGVHCAPEAAVSNPVSSNDVATDTSSCNNHEPCSKRNSKMPTAKHDST